MLSLTQDEQFMVLNPGSATTPLFRQAADSFFEVCCTLRSQQINSNVDTDTVQSHAALQ